MIGPAGSSVEGALPQRSYGTAVAVELDALVIAASTPPESGATPTLDARAAPSGEVDVDARVVELLRQAWRHAKPIAAMGEGKDVLARVGIDGAGMVSGQPAALVDDLTDLLAAHRVWQRFEPAGADA